MSDDKKPVPTPGEAHRGDDDVHYYDIDETNVSDADKSEPPRTDDVRRPDDGES
jgi:hypothetical protein